MNIIDNSRITEVTIYQNGARLTRSAQLRIEAGQQIFAIQVDSKTIHEKTIQVLTDTEKISIQQVQIQQISIPNPALPSDYTEETIDALNQDIIKLKDKLTVLQAKQSAMTALNQSYASEMGRHIATDAKRIDELNAIFAYVESTLTDLLNQIQAVQSDIAEKETLKKRPKTVNINCIVISLYADEELDSPVIIQYSIPDAFWKADYHLHLSEVDTTKLVYHANIEQSSGESWQDVSLILSTSKINDTLQFSDVSTWTIDETNSKKQQALITRRLSENLSKDMDFKAGHSIVMRGGMKEAREEIAEEMKQMAEGAGYVLSYRLDGTPSLESNAKPIQLLVGIFPLDIQLDYSSFPKQSQQAIWRAKIINRSPLAMLAGNINVFEGNALLTQAELNKMIAPDEEFLLPLMIEERIKIQRRLLERTAFIDPKTNFRKIYYRYQIKISNYCTDSISIVVRDQIPMSLSSNIQVELESYYPESSVEHEQQLLRWELLIQSQEIEQLEFAFSVTFPRHLEIEGII